MASTTLAHLSDVHLAPITGFDWRYWNMKRALGLANWRRGRSSVHLRAVADTLAGDVVAQAPDHIAVTGDLANLGLPGEFQTALGWLKRLGSPETVSVVPGNHDIYTDRMHGASCLTDWAPYLSSDAWGRSFTNERAGFPYIRKTPVAVLIGVNSAEPTPPFVAAGRIGPDQLALLERDLLELKRQPLPRVVMVHHAPLPGQSPPRRALRDAEALKAVLERTGAELVVHGHNHTQTLVRVSGAGGATPVCGVASASAALTHGDEPLARYALYRFTVGEDGARPAIEQIVRGLHTPDGPVVEIERRIL